MGMRGRPTKDEVARAKKVGAKVKKTLGRKNSKAYNERISALAVTAFKKGTRSKQNWTSVETAKATVAGLAEGYAARNWSMDLIEKSL